MAEWSAVDEGGGYDGGGDAARVRLLAGDDARAIISRASVTAMLLLWLSLVAVRQRRRDLRDAQLVIISSASPRSFSCGFT